jgi:hypothetical protein
MMGGWWTMRGCLPAAALLLAACAGDAEPAGDAADTARIAAAPPVRTPADSAVGAEVAAAEPPPPAAQDTGYTAWRALEMPSEPWTQRAADPRALLTLVRDVVAAQLEEPDAGMLPSRLQYQQADSAVGILVHPDQADDSVRDVEFRLHMRREGAQWAVVAVDRRERCRRGVASGGLCA